VTGNSPPVESNNTLKYITERGGNETLYTGPVTVGDWEFIEFRLYDEGGALLDRENVLVLRDGPPATVYRLVPGAPMIVQDVSGAASPSEISCAQEVVIGNNPPEFSDKTIKYIVSNNQTELEYSSPVPVAWDWIEFRLYDNHALLDSERVFVLREGEPARTYDLWPSSPVIRLYNGITEPFRISCLQVSVTGSGLPALSDKTLKYATSLSEEQPYAGEITVNPLWLWIEFRLYDGDVLLDKERVPMLADGSTRISLDLVNQNIAARSDEDGNVAELPITTQAVLYKGNAPVSHADFMAKVAEQNIVRYPGADDNAFDPMLGDFYPVKTSWWFLSENPLTKKDAIVHYPGSEENIFDPMLGDFYPTWEEDKFIPLSQASVDQNGLVTVKRLDDDETIITVNVAYDGAIYSAPLKLIKVKEAARPVVIDIENENTSIACDVYGDPYPGELPLQTKAILFRGTELVSPFWFLGSAAKGISITQDGTITVARNADLADVNNAVVKAAFRGKTYARMFTLSKTRDGESPIAIDLLPDNEVIQCDYMGNPLRGLPLTAQATLYKGTQEITAAMELAEAARVEIIYYPDPGNIFDPMLGDFCPTLGYPVVWSLAGAPPGVTIDSNGFIAVSGTAELSDINEITVRAKYHGKTHEAIFGIAKARGGSPGAIGKDGDAALFPRYRGVTLIADTGNTGIITLKSGGRIYMNDLDWVLFMGTADWTKARLYKWHEAEKWWEMLDPAQNTLDYMGALNDITEGAPDGIFSVVFCRLLFAQQAAIATLESQLIQVQNAIFGGERFTKSEDSVVDNGADKTGFLLGANGKLLATSGEFNNVKITGDSLFEGRLSSGPLLINQDVLYTLWRYYSGNTAIGTIMNNEFSFWGKSTGTAPVSVDKLVSGTYASKYINRIIIYDQGRAGVGNNSGITFFYADGTNEEILNGANISGLLSFSYITAGWQIRMNNLPTEDPKIAGAVWRNGNYLAISLG
jgi:hypothetical protein